MCYHEPLLHIGQVLFACGLQSLWLVNHFSTRVRGYLGTAVHHDELLFPITEVLFSHGLQLSLL